MRDYVILEFRSHTRSCLKQGILQCNTRIRAVAAASDVMSCGRHGRARCMTISANQNIGINLHDEEAECVLILVLMRRDATGIYDATMLREMIYTYNVDVNERWGLNGQSTDHDFVSKVQSIVQQNDRGTAGGTGQTKQPAKTNI
ncbi:hypothetical protein A0H81_07032 [Grifola frondosa]|uniref:Uncharacterized protein n=1 Tax=Grifola frondosa TaxID=5627 RepID=A0A1C7M8X4_GRIFR|nr:hypothetical protein A0H81_07032 [Grifola frondosa]